MYMYDIVFPLSIFEQIAMDYWNVHSVVVCHIPCEKFGDELFWSDECVVGKEESLRELFHCTQVEEEEERLMTL